MSLSCKTANDGWFAGMVSTTWAQASAVLGDRATAVSKLMEGQRLCAAVTVADQGRLRFALAYAGSSLGVRVLVLEQLRLAFEENPDSVLVKWESAQLLAAISGEAPVDPGGIANGLNAEETESLSCRYFGFDGG